MNFRMIQDNFPRVFRPSIEEFKSVGEDVPFVITGIVPEWPAYTKWTTDYLKEKYGQSLVCVRVMDKKKGIYNEDKQMLLKEYLENAIENNRPDVFHYLTEQNLNCFPGFGDDYKVPEYIKGKRSVKGFWLSAKHIYSHLHYDLPHNFLAQVAGQKRLIIYPPNLSCLYLDKQRQRSHINIENPDYNRFPNFKFSQPRVCILKAGEMLYLPSCWWHHVISEGDLNISMNFFSRPSTYYILHHLRFLLAIFNLKEIKTFLRN